MRKNRMYIVKVGKKLVYVKARKVEYDNHGHLKFTGKKDNIKALFACWDRVEKFYA